MICILCYIIIRRMGTRQTSLWTNDWLCRHPQSSVCYAISIQELTQLILQSFFFCQISMCICLLLPILILSVDSDWLISITVIQTLTGNRNYYHSLQSWSNFDHVRQSGIYTIKVDQSDSNKLCSKRL